MENQLIICALGEDRPGLVVQLTKVIADVGCNVLDGRMTVLGSDFGLMQLVSGRWDALAKLETHLPAVARELGLDLRMKRTHPARRPGDQLSYAVDVLGMNQPGILHRVARFFAEREINIRDLASSTFTAAHTGTIMFSLHLTVDIPASNQIAPIREDFFDYCDRYNLDALFDPVKN